MKPYRVQNDLERFLSGGKWDSKQEQLKRRIVGYVLGARREDRIRRLGEIMVWLERTYWMRRTTKPTAVALIHTISEALIEHKFQHVFLEIAKALFQSRTVFNPFQTMFQGGPRTEAELKIAARHWFFVEYLRYVGETLEKSMQFALFLLEQFAITSERAWNIMAQGGQTDHAKTVGEPSAIVLTLVFESATCPPSSDTPAKAWLERLIEEAEDNPAVEEVLHSILGLLVILRPDNRFVVSVVPDNTIETAAHVMAERLSGQWQPHPDTPTMLLLNKHDIILSRVSEQRLIRTQREKEQGNRVLVWVMSNSERLLDICQERIRAIHERPRRGLRPNGLDHVDINVTPLRNAGLRAVVLHPEGYTFPDVGVEVIVRKETPHLMRLRLPDADTQWPDMLADALYNTTHPDIEALCMLFMFILTDIFYRIVVGEKELREKKRWHHTGDETTVVRSGGLVAVRPIFRRLPAGWKPTPGAFSKARNVMGSAWIPPGRTFVSPYSYIRAQYQGSQLVYDLPTEPVAVYGDEDLLETGEWS